MTFLTIELLFTHLLISRSGGAHASQKLNLANTGHNMGAFGTPDGAYNQLYLTPTIPSPPPQPADRTIKYQVAFNKNTSKPQQETSRHNVTAEATVVSSKTLRESKKKKHSQILLPQSKDTFGM